MSYGHAIDGVRMGSLAPWFEAYGFPKPLEEFRFHPTRKWRFDYLFGDYDIAIEVNGGVWTRGRHVRGRGFESDMEKLNQAQIMGYVVLQFTPEQFKTGEASVTIREALEKKGWKA